MQKVQPFSHRPDPGSSGVVVRLAGDFDDEECARAFMECVGQLLAAGHPAVLFDCARVQFRDVAAIRCLVYAHREFRRAQRQMALSGIPPAIERILALITLHHPITVYDCSEEWMQ